MRPLSFTLPQGWGVGRFPWCITCCFWADFFLRFSNSRFSHVFLGFARQDEDRMDPGRTQNGRRMDPERTQEYVLLAFVFSGIRQSVGKFRGQRPPSNGTARCCDHSSPRLSGERPRVRARSAARGHFSVNRFSVFSSWLAFFVHSFFEAQCLHVPAENGVCLSKKPNRKCIESA
jgi:hypothetical protein